MFTVAMVALLLGTLAHCSLANPEWGEKLNGALTARDSVINVLIGGSNDVLLTANNEVKVKELADSLDQLLNELKNFESLDLSTKGIDSRLSSQIPASASVKTKVDTIFPNNDLQSKYALGSMITRLKSSRDLDSMCSRYRANTHKFSTKTICLSTKKCGNVIAAVPKLAALLWYQVSAFLLKSLCRPMKETIEQDYEVVRKTVYPVGAYVSSTLDWDAIFENIETTNSVY